MTNLKKLNSLINKVCKLYKVNKKVKSLALKTDPRALKHIANIVANSPAKININDLQEVVKWGINWDLSKYKILQKSK